MLGADLVGSIWRSASGAVWKVVEADVAHVRVERADTGSRYWWHVDSLAHTDMVRVEAAPLDLPELVPFGG